MKCLVFAYINSERLMADIEGVLDYYHFSVIEDHPHFKAFTGFTRGSVGQLADQLNRELEGVEFDIHDSLFMVYPLRTPEGIPSLANIIIKRKGNRHLRNKSMR